MMTTNEQNILRADSSPPPGTQTVDILLVEDNANDLELTVRTLRKHVLTTHIAIARDGVEALDFIHATGSFSGRDVNQRPRLILLDLKLPKLDGIEVLRRIRDNESTRHIPVVMLTSSREVRDIERAYKFGANSYVVKPVDFESFTRSVSELGEYWIALNETL